jgi:acyl dehydratase
MGYGRWFEEFTVGDIIRHWPGRTITEADCTWFALLTMNQHPIHSDAHYAATHTQHGQRLVLGPLVFSIGIGMTVADVSGKAIANLEIERITHEAPTFIGDTIYSESTVLAKRDSKQGDRGTVTVETRVTNQRGERVMTFKRTALVPKKNHATLGEQAEPRAPGTGHPRPEPGPRTPLQTEPRAPGTGHPRPEPGPRTPLQTEPRAPGTGHPRPEPDSRTPLQ